MESYESIDVDEDELPGDVEEPVFYGERRDTGTEGTQYRKVVADEVTEAMLDGDEVPDHGLVLEYDQDAMVEAYPRLEEHL